MDLKVLALLLLYWGIWIALSIGVFATGGLTGTGLTVTASLNGSSLAPDEITTGGIFGAGVSFLRFAGFVLFGVGLPAGTPAIVSTLLAVFQSSMTIFTVGWFISAIWNG